MLSSFIIYEHASTIRLLSLGFFHTHNKFGQKDKSLNQYVGNCFSIFFCCLSVYMFINKYSTTVFALCSRFTQLTVIKKYGLLDTYSLSLVYDLDGLDLLVISRRVWFGRIMAGSEAGVGHKPLGRHLVQLSAPWCIVALGATVALLCWHLLLYYST